MNTLALAGFLGAITGLGVFAFIRALSPSRRSAAATIAQIDALRAAGPSSGPAPRPTDLRGRVGQRVAAFYLEQGWELRSMRADLAVLERSWEAFLATKILLGAVGLVFGPFLYALIWQLGFGVSPIIPVWLALVCAGVFFLLPDLEVRRDAAEKRKDLRRVIGAYLDLVAMNLAVYGGIAGWITGMVAAGTRRGRSYGVWAIILGILAPVVGMVMMVAALMPYVG